MCEPLIWTPKPWGETACVMADADFEFWLCRVLAGGYSSLHHHERKWNRISSRSAVVRITEEGFDRIIGPGEFVDIPPRVQHRFEVIEPGSMWETYWGDCDLSDIVRVDQNGRRMPSLSHSA